MMGDDQRTREDEGRDQRTRADEGRAWKMRVRREAREGR